jgi:hypothetical protein
MIEFGCLDLRRSKVGGTDCTVLFWQLRGWLRSPLNEGMCERGCVLSFHQLSNYDSHRSNTTS